MKKISYYFLAALSILAVSSCAKDILEVEEAPAGAARTFVLDLGSVTRTNITEAGKTIWAKGDKVLLTDGAALDTIAVPETAEGQPTAEITTTKISGETVFAIYPIQAVASTTPSSIIAEDGTVNVKIPADQGGDFADANIMVGKATDLKFAMKNVAAVLKIHAATGVEKVVFNASGDALAGNLAVSFGEDNTVSEVKASGTTGILTLNAMGGDADFYVAVAPGTYKTGFNLIALDNEGKFESKKSGSENTLKVNELADLGVVGAPENMKGFEGEGTEAAPYKIGNIGEMMAFANTVNTGMKYKGKNFKLTGDISGVTLPIGYYISADNQGSFAGTFDGDNHTVTVDLDGVNCKSASYVAMFGLVDSSAVIKNVKVEGKVQTTGNYAAGLVAYCRGAAVVKDSVTISNCVSNVTVESSASYTGGLVGYALRTVIEDCQNLGSVTGKNSTAGIVGQTQYTKITGSSNAGTISGTYNVGGIEGYAYQTTFINDINSGAVSGNYTTRGVYAPSTGSWQYVALDGSYNDWSGGQANTLRGVAGISGYAQNSTFTKTSNSGAISGLGKVAGIIGASYSNTVDEASNSGAITGTEDMIGGITGWVFTHSTIKNSTNSGKISGRCSVGGIAGLHNLLGYSSSSAVSYINNCTNTGEIAATKGLILTMSNIKIADASAAGGIIGTLSQLGKSSGARGYCHINDCVNEGRVTAEGNYAAGIAGFLWNGYQYSVDGTLNNCVNKADVTGLSGVAGIIGGMWERYTGHAKEQVRNVQNSGKISATITGAASKANAGGIVGVTWYNSTTTSGASYGIRLYNALNTGDVVYADAAAASPCAGGIVGTLANGVIQNAYNSGAVKPISGEAVEAAAASLGSIAGYLGAFKDAWAAINYAYYLSGTAAKAIGTSNATPGVNISEVNAAGDLVTRTGDNEIVGNVLNVYDNDYSTVLDALNAWSDKNASSYKYYYWTAGPVFTKE